MNDDTTPRRVRGRKAQDAAYRAGYLAGYQAGLDHAERLRDADAEREQGIAAGLDRYRAEQAGAPKRTRRRRTTDIGTGTNPNVIHDAVTGETTPYER
jgi:hypothetical protein